MEPPVLRAGIDHAPPAPMQISTPQAADFRGYEVDLLQELARRLGSMLQYRRAVWSVIVDELSCGLLDVVCSAATVTAERAQLVDFCTPHLKLALSLVTRQPVDGPFDLETARLGARHGTTAEAFVYVRTGHEPAMLSESNEELYRGLADGKLDGVIDDSPIALYFAGLTPGLVYAHRFDGADGEYAVMVRRTNRGLRERINAALFLLEGFFFHGGGSGHTLGARLGIIRISKNGWPAHEPRLGFQRR